LNCPNLSFETIDFYYLSGTKTVVIIPWNRPSKENSELMTRFYTLISEGKTKAEALRQSKMEMMIKKKNPFYWGAFIMVGKPE
jgi:CHAT domain-containing protein